MNTVTGLANVSVCDSGWSKLFGRKMGVAVGEEQLAAVFGPERRCERVVFGGDGVRALLVAGESAYVLTRDFSAVISELAPCLDCEDHTIAYEVNLRFLGSNGNTTAFNNALAGRVAALFRDTIRAHFAARNYANGSTVAEPKLAAEVEWALRGKPNLDLGFQAPPAKGFALTHVHSAQAESRQRDRATAAQVVGDFSEEQKCRAELRRLLGEDLVSKASHELLKDLLALHRGQTIDLEKALGRVRLLEVSQQEEFLRAQIQRARDLGNLERRTEAAKAEKAELEAEMARLERDLKHREGALLDGQVTVLKRKIEDLHQAGLAATDSTAQLADAVQKLQDLLYRQASAGGENRGEAPAVEFSWRAFSLDKSKGLIQPLPATVAVLPTGSLLQIGMKAKAAGYVYVLALCRSVEPGDRPGDRAIVYAWETLFGRQGSNTMRYCFHRREGNHLEAGESLCLPKDGRPVGGMMQNFWVLDRVSGGCEFIYCLFSPEELTGEELSLMQPAIPARAFSTRGFEKPGSQPSWDHIQGFSQNVVEVVKSVAPKGSVIEEMVFFHS
ncbi:MAG: hypothetical protein NT154_09640 [Verrucomicrobia bacterium]|nr:hypothetical protein [Verrucomicrobiota bacterium]